MLHYFVIFVIRLLFTELCFKFPASHPAEDLVEEEAEESQGEHDHAADHDGRLVWPISSGVKVEVDVMAVVVGWGVVRVAGE